MIVVFTDLDGSLLDSDYSYEGAEDTIEKLKSRGVKICIVTSKTFREIVPLWRELNLDSPFSFENGQGIAAPRGFLPEVDEVVDQFEIHSFGPDYEMLRSAIERVEKEVGDIDTFGDMDVEEIVELTGLPKEDAEKSLKRRHSEVFIPDNEAAEKLEEKGYKVIEGTNFFHLLGKPDKGTAVRYLKEIMKPDITFSIGDAENDYPMFKETDYAVLLDADGSEDVEAKKIGEKGPKGWSKGISWFLEKLDI